MLNERELTKKELEKREKAMMDLKTNKRSFVKRYGKDAEAVMYGRATNIAKKQAENMNKEKLRELIKTSLMSPGMDPEAGEDRYKGEQDLATASHALDQLEAKLKAHDWYYMMSDDHRAYTNGRHEQSEIRSIMNDLEGLGYGKDAKELYNQYAPFSEGGPDFRMKEAKGKDMDKDGDIDSDDYLAARDAAIKKAKGEVKEGFYGSSDIEDVTNALGYSDPYEFFQDNPGAIDALMSWVESVPEFRDMLKDADLLQEKYANHPVQVQLRTKNAKAAKEKEKKEMKEDLDLGHQDNEPHMLKADLYRIGKYAMELYQMVDDFEGKGEVDFPSWWQAKIINSKDAIVGAKHYLDFELKEPQIDAVVDVASEEEVIDEGTWAVGSSKDIKTVMDALDQMMDLKRPQDVVRYLSKLDKFLYNTVGDDLFHDDIDGAKSEAKEGNMDRVQNRLSDAYSRAEYFLERQMDREGLKEEEAGEVDMLASDIQKAMNKHKKDDVKMYQLQQARKAMNKGDLEKAKKIAARLAEKLKSN